MDHQIPSAQTLLVPRTRPLLASRRGSSPYPSVLWGLARVIIVSSFFFPWPFQTIFKRATRVPLHKYKSVHIPSLPESPWGLIGLTQVKSQVHIMAARPQWSSVPTTPLRPHPIQPPLLSFPFQTLSPSGFELTRCAPTSGPWHMLLSHQIPTWLILSSHSGLYFNVASWIGTSSLYSLSLFSYLIFLHSTCDYVY